jgi:hypothetical protein
MRDHNLTTLDLLRNFTQRVNNLLPSSVARVLFWDEMFDNLGAKVPKMAGKPATIEVGESDHGDGLGGSSMLAGRCGMTVSS